MGESTCGGGGLGGGIASSTKPTPTSENAPTKRIEMMGSEDEPTKPTRDKGAWYGPTGGRRAHSWAATVSLLTASLSVSSAATFGDLEACVTLYIAVSNRKRNALTGLGDLCVSACATSAEDATAANLAFLRPITAFPRFFPLGRLVP